MTGIAAETTDGSIYDHKMLDAHLADLKEFAADLAGTYPWDDEEFKVEFDDLKSENDEEIVWDATITKL